MNIFYSKLQFSFYFSEPDEKAILQAAENGNLEKVKNLLAKNPSLIEAADIDGYTPLHRACYGNHIEIVEVFIKNNIQNS